MKLVEIAMVHVLGSIEDERIFSSVAFFKDKVKNALDEHLPFVVGMYSQKVYTLDGFPYNKTFVRWCKLATKRGRYGLGK